MNYTSYPQLYYHFIFIPMYTLVHASVHRPFSPQQPFHKSTRHNFTQPICLTKANRRRRNRQFPRDCSSTIDLLTFKGFRQICLERKHAGDYIDTIYVATLRYIFFQILLQDFKIVVKLIGSEGF